MSSLRDAIRQYGSGRAAADALGIAETTFRRRLLKEEHPALVEDAEAAGYDPEAVGIYWNKTKAISAMIRVPQEAPAADWVLESIRAALTADLVPPSAAPAYVDYDYLNMVALPDWHLLMQAWGKETGESYDLSIAEREFKVAVARLLRDAPRAAHAVILGVGDQFHTNTPKNQTEHSGHFLQVDGRIPKAFDIALWSFVYAIRTALQTHETVEVRILPGNHDGFLATILEAALAAVFATEPRVRCQPNPSYFYARQFGDVMLAATHGNNVKPGETGRTKMAAIIAHRFRAIYGATKHRFLFTGDKHHEKTGDLPGWLFVQLRAMTAQDAYAAQSFMSAREVSLWSFHCREGRKRTLHEALPLEFLSESSE